MNAYLERAMELEDEIIRNRRHIHKYPELGMELPKTVRFVCEKLRSYGYKPELIGGGVTGTMRIVDGTVVDSVIGSPVDPGGVIPDLDELLAVIGRAEAAANTIAGISIRAELVADENYRLIVTKS